MLVTASTSDTYINHLSRMLETTRQYIKGKLLFRLRIVYVAARQKPLLNLDKFSEQSYLKDVIMSAIEFVTKARLLLALVKICQSRT